MSTLFSVRHKLSRFDLIVLGVLVTLGVGTGLLWWRGDRVGVRVRSVDPAPNSVGVSTRVEIRIPFQDPMDKASVESRFRIEPAVEGRFSWRGQTLTWRPSGGLPPDTQSVVTLEAGARSTQGRRLMAALSWTFHTGRPRVVYMSVGDVSQLYAVEPNTLRLQQLTNYQDGSSVWDYAVGPEGKRIAFGLVRPDGSAVDLWLMDVDDQSTLLLMACDGQQCSGPHWSPDGRNLAFERRDLNVDLGGIGSGLGPSRVWLYDLTTGEHAPLFGDSQMLGYAPRWSPDGRRLGYFDPQGGVRLVDIGAGTSQLIPNQLGEMGSWSPDGEALVVVDLSLQGESTLSYLLRVDLVDATRSDLSGKVTKVNDGSPAWSPTGEWIAFGRKSLADGTPVAGQQLWLMRPDGSEARALVTDSEAHLGSIDWSPDGRRLVYQRFPLMQANARPGIWVITLEGGEPIRLADRATVPRWLP